MEQEYSIKCSWHLLSVGLDVSWEALEEMLVQMASNTLFVTYKAFLRVFEDTRGKKSCGRADPDDVCSAVRAHVYSFACCRNDNPGYAHCKNVESRCVKQ